MMKSTKVKSSTPPPRPPAPDASKRASQAFVHADKVSSPVRGSKIVTKSPSNQHPPTALQANIVPRDPSKPLVPVRPAPAPPSDQQFVLGSAHSSSSSSVQPDAFSKSSPTLGTITYTPVPELPHVSPFPNNSSPAATGGQAASASETHTSGNAAPDIKNANSPHSSIQTGSTPLSLTPGGSSTPVKFTQPGLTVTTAITTPESGLSLSGLPRSSGKQTTLQIEQELHKPPQQPAVNQTMMKQEQIRVGAKQTTNELQHSKGIASEQLAKTVRDMPLSGNANTSKSGTNWAIYLFLGIFLLVLLILIIALVITKQRK